MKTIIADGVFNQKYTIAFDNKNDYHNYYNFDENVYCLLNRVFYSYLAPYKAITIGIDNININHDKRSITIDFIHKLAVNDNYDTKGYWNIMLSAFMKSSEDVDWEQGIVTKVKEALSERIGHDFLTYLMNEGKTLPNDSEDKSLYEMLKRYTVTLGKIIIITGGRKLRQVVNRSRKSRVVNSAEDYGGGDKYNTVTIPRCLEQFGEIFCIDRNDTVNIVLKFHEEASGEYLNLYHDTWVSQEVEWKKRKVHYKKAYAKLSTMNILTRAKATGLIKKLRQFLYGVMRTNYRLKYYLSNEHDMEFAFKKHTKDIFNINADGPFLRDIGLTGATRISYYYVQHYTITNTLHDWGKLTVKKNYTGFQVEAISFVKTAIVLKYACANKYGEGKNVYKLLTLWSDRAKPLTSTVTNAEGASEDEIRKAAASGRSFKEESTGDALKREDPELAETCVRVAETVEEILNELD